MNNRLSKTDNEHGHEIRSLTLSNFFIQIHVIVEDLSAVTTTTIMMMLMMMMVMMMMTMMMIMVMTVNSGKADDEGKEEKQEDYVDDENGGGGDDDDSGISDSRQKNDVFYIILSNVLLHFNGNARLGSVLVRPDVLP